MSKASNNTDDLTDKTSVTIGSFTIPRDFVWVLLLALILVVGLVIASTWPWAVHKNDPLAFAERSRPLLDGHLPYIDFEFEHLPLAIFPMLSAALLETIIPIHYTLIFWLLMGGVLFAIGVYLNKIGSQLGVTDVALRWVLISWALLPLLAFRVDALSVLLTLVAVSLGIAGHDRKAGWAMAGAIAAKGWPIVLAVVDWWRGKRRRAIITVGLTIVLGIGLTMFPLFRSGRSFFGVHIETFTGAFVALFRILADEPTQVDVAAGASYVEVGGWAMAVNILIGLGLGLYAIRVLRTKFDWRRALDLIGVLTIALMLLSPLLSAQFVIWMTPFAALSSNHRVRIGAAAAAFLTGVFVTFWFIDSWWWWAVIAGRNLCLVGTGWTWARHLLVTKPSPAEQVMAS
ncbi:MAG: hypothetical protein GY788_25910 [bacterium]|nr:hypothetical protein [bacterium]